MSLQFFLSFSVSLIALQYVSCEKDLKAEFGDKLGASMRTSGIELFLTATRSINEFYDRLLREASPTPKQMDELKKEKMNLDDLRKKIPNTINEPQKFIELLIEFISSKHISVIKQETKTLNSYGESKKPIILKAINDTAETIKEAGTKFAMGVSSKWTELYENLPKEELNKYPEYKKINELMQNVAETKGRSSAFSDVMRDLIVFFEADKWKFFLDLSPPNSMEKN